MSRPKRPNTLMACSGCQVNPLDLGEIKGKLDVIYDTQKATADSHGKKLDALDARLRTVENKSAVMSAGMGAAASLIVVTTIEFIKSRFRSS